MIEDPFNTAYLGDSNEAAKARVIHRESEDPVDIFAYTIALLKTPIDKIRDLFTNNDRNFQQGIDRTS